MAVLSSTPNLLEQGRKTLGFPTQSSFRKFLALSIPFTLFILLNSPYLSLSYGFCGPSKNTLRAGSCYWFQHPTQRRYNLALRVHLFALLPAGLLSIPQFIPKLRYRYPALHRWSGRLSFGLAVPGVLSVLFFMDRSFGGGLDVQSSSVFLGGMTLWAVGKAWMTAREKRFEEHKRWATRAWVWLGCIVTHRGVMGVFALYISLVASGPKLAATVSCPEVWEMVRHDHGTGLAARVAWERYEMCGEFGAGNGTRSEGVYGIVYGDLMSQRPEEKAAALRLVFGPAFWVAIVCHVAATELYFGRKGASGRRAGKAMDGVEVEGKGVKSL
ncbi:MAG: hypothetical protein Q9184_004141 [Pyrenodesmia sp. 2 TL-2023]